MSKALESIGTEAHPLRASALPLLIRCPWRYAMVFLDTINDESGAAADTGSAVHAAVAEWHGSNFDVERSLGEMRRRVGEYPLADLHDAELSFRKYADDTANRVRCVAIERRVTFTLAPAEGDTGLIHVAGTLDQIREVGGVLSVWDVKTGKKQDGYEMVHAHALQLAAYAVGASQALGRDVQPGGVIRTYSYRQRTPAAAHWPAPFTLDQCDLLLDSLRVVVRELRRGNVWPGPGEHCGYCPAGGLDGCVPKLLEVLR